MTAGKYVICIPERGIKTSTPPLTFGPSRRPEVSGWGEAGVRRAAGGEKKKHNWILMRCSRFRAGWSEQSSAANFLFRSLTDFWDKKNLLKKKTGKRFRGNNLSADCVDPLWPACLVLSSPLQAVGVAWVIREVAAPELFKALAAHFSLSLPPRPDAGFWFGFALVFTPHNITHTLFHSCTQLHH